MFSISDSMIYLASQLGLNAMSLTILKLFCPSKICFGLTVVVFSINEFDQFDQGETIFWEY